ncbi:MAG: magnesium transporter [Myxococcota bacterium]|nr:magnesium transporter [Myxococcota bacterium]MDW8362590.1 magnesium transporter [Myxococcales bacterium]
MRLGTLLGPDLRETLATDPSAVAAALEELHAEDIAEIVEELDDATARALLRVLPAGVAAEVVGRLPAERQVSIVTALDDDRAAEIVAEMAVDDAVDLVQELPAPVAEKLLEQIEQTEPAVAEDVRELRAFPPDSAGGLMTTEFASVTPETKVWQAIELVRQKRHELETAYYLYVVAYDRLVGVVSLRDLLLADPGASLADVMTTNVVHVAPTEHQEQVARLIAKYDLNALPVVDERGAMLGVVTVDDVVDVVIEEATEDVHKMGAVAPLEDSYLQTGFFTFVRKRAGWLVVLFLGQTLTATVIESRASVLEQIQALAFFIPLIISSGGNSGSQSSTLVIRALAIGEVQPRHWWRVLAREILMGLTLGFILCWFGFARAWFSEGGASVPFAATVAASVVGVVTLGTTIGAILPLAIKRFGLDPAVSSTPFIASLLDVLGLLVYFGMATLILGVT